MTNKLPFNLLTFSQVYVSVSKNLTTVLENVSQTALWQLLGKQIRRGIDDA